MKSNNGRILYRKIRYAKGRVQLEWMEKMDDQVRYGSIDDFNEPMDSFKNAMKDLANDCITLCELLADNEFENRIEVHTINIKYEAEKEIPGINISFKINRIKKSGAYSITTPYQLLKPKDDEEEQTEDNQILFNKIKLLMNEADNYRTGKRKQLNIEFDNNNNSDSFIVKLEGEKNGLLRPGILMSFNNLVNNESICKQNGTKGIYNINPVERMGTIKAFKAKNLFTFKRNGDILLLNQILDKNIEEYEADSLNSFVIDLIDEYFKD